MSVLRNSIILDLPPMFGLIARQQTYWRALKGQYQ